MILAGFSDGILRLLTLRRIDQANELVLKQVSTARGRMREERNVHEIVVECFTNRSCYLFIFGPYWSGVDVLCAVCF